MNPTFQAYVCNYERLKKYNLNLLTTILKSSCTYFWQVTHLELMNSHKLPTTHG